MVNEKSSLSYWSMTCRVSLSQRGSYENSTGAEDQNRTGDTLIFSQVLYQLSYLGTVRDCTSADRGCQANLSICHLKLKTGLINSDLVMADLLSN